MSRIPTWSHICVAPGVPGVSADEASVRIQHWSWRQLLTVWNPVEGQPSPSCSVLCKVSVSSF